MVCANITRKVVPFGDQILFKQIIKDTTDGGIILVNPEREHAGFEVQAVGPAVKEVFVGDFIIFRANDPLQVGNAGVEDKLFLIAEEKVVAKLVKIEKGDK